MYQLVGIVFSATLHVCACEILKTHSNITSGDLLDSSDYSEPVERVYRGAPSWLRHDENKHTAVYVDLQYGDQDCILEATKEKLLMKKKPVPNSDMNEIWYIPYEDQELKVFFSKVLNLDPAVVTIVHVAAFRGECSVKKILLKTGLMSDQDIVERLKASVGQPSKK